MNKYSNLSKPIKIGGVEIKNRMFMAPMDTGFGNTEYGGFTDEGIEYFTARAKGGFGLLFSGGTNADYVVDGNDSILNHPKEFIAQGKKLNQKLNEYGSKMFIQLSMNIGRNGGLKTPSPLPLLGNPSVKTDSLTVEEIHMKVEEMGKAAKLCKEAGFAGVDIHALHWGHLLDSFALPFMNHRNDEYGGSLKNRLRITKEIVEAIKRECGQDFPVTMRLALKSYMKDFNKASFDGSEEVGRTLEEAIEIAKELEAYGYDGLSTDTGTLDAFYYSMPPSYVPAGYTINMAAQVKKAVNIPILCGGRMANPDLNEEAINSELIDAVVIGRQAIADPEYANKVLENRTDEIRYCIGCNQGCIWGYSLTGKVGCAVNPNVGHEKDELKPTKTSKKVLVIGGGVAGMEAANTAFLRGYDVSLYEKSNHLGGNLIPAGAHDFKNEVHQLNDYYKRQLELHQIDIHLGEEMNSQKIKQLNPDVVILALGANPIVPPIAGVDGKNVLLAEEALVGERNVGHKVIIVGGGLVGCEIAYGYLQEGKEVTIVEAMDELMKADVPIMNKTMLLDSFEYYNAEVLTSSRLKSINSTGAVVSLPDGSDKQVEADTIIMSVGYRSSKSFADELKDAGIETYEVGDVNKVGNIMTCIHDAYEVASQV